MAAKRKPPAYQAYPGRGSTIVEVYGEPHLFESDAEALVWLAKIATIHATYKRISDEYEEAIHHDSTDDTQHANAHLDGSAVS